MTETQWVGIAMTAGGAFLLGAVVFQWSFFVKSSRYRLLADALGEWTPRIIWGLMGAILLFFGVFGALGKWRGGLDFSG